MAQAQEIQIKKLAQQQVPQVQPSTTKKRYWVEAVSTEYLFNRLSNFKDDRLTTAAMMIELAERAERNVMLQELLRKLRMPEPFDIFEYKRGNKHRKGHWARRAYTREFPTPAQAEARLQMAELTHALFGTKGNMERDNDTTIARINYIVGEELRGKKIVSDEVKEERKKLSRMVEIAGEVVEIVP
jgi:hypothetical protein